MKTPTNPHHQNKTAYARSIGYTGRKAVIVSDGKVVSHARIDWFIFCNQCRTP
jgi:hypothetical protein